MWKAVQRALQRLSPGERLALSYELIDAVIQLRASVPGCNARKGIPLGRKTERLVAQIKSPDQLLELADRLEADSIALRIRARIMATANLTPAEKRYCKLEGIRQRDYLARKRGRWTLPS